MAVIVVTTTVNNIEATIEIFDRIKIFRSTNQAGPFAEITTPATRIPLEPEIAVYQYTDLDGDATYWYQSSFFNASTGRESEPSEPARGDAGTATIVCTPDELRRNFFFGIDLTDDDGNELADAVFQTYIDAAVEWFETETDLKVRPTDVTERYDYLRSDWQNWALLKLNQYPVISVDRYTLRPPGGQEIDLPLDAIELRRDIGQITLNPAKFNSVSYGFTGNALAAFVRADWVPNMIEISYTAGFATIPKNIKLAICMAATLGIFDILGDLIAGAGIATKSISIDSLSQSVGTTSSATNAGYGSRILSYSKRLDKQMKSIINYYKGIRMEVA